MKKIYYDDDNIVQTLTKVSPKLNDTLGYCTIGSKIECSKIFIHSLAYRGLCFTFNMLGYHSIFNSNISADFDGYKRKNITKSWKKGSPLECHDDDGMDIEPSNWTIHGGYSTEEDWVQPMRASGLQYLSVVTKVNNIELPNFCKGYYNAYKVSLHFPDEIPSFSNVFTSISLKEFKYVRISANIQKVDENFLKFPPEQRKCFDENERKLRFFKSYTKLNCEHECMTNFSYKSCGCVSISMPRTDDMKVCNFEKIDCSKNIFKFWAKSFYENDENKQMYPDFPCNCFPTCTKIEYEIVTEFSMNMKQAR